MEQMINETFMGLGVVGAICLVFLRKYLEESKEDRKIQQEERKQDRDLYRKSVETFADNSRKYIETIATLTVRIENVEENIEGVDNKLDKILEKVGE